MTRATQPRDMPPRGAASVSRVSRWLGRHLSLDTLVRMWSAELPRWVKRDGDMGAALPEPLSHRALLSDEAIAALEARGGGPAVAAELERLRRFNTAISAAVLCKGLEGSAADIRVHGLDDLRAAAAEGRGVVLVEPHLGPYGLFPVHLALSDITVGLVVDVSKPPIDLRNRLFVLLLHPFLKSGRLRVIRVPGPTSAIGAMDVLRSGGVLFWQPLAFPFMARTKDTVPINFLGVRLDVPSASFRLARRVGARYVLAYSRLHQQDERPLVELHYEVLDLSPDTVEATRQLYGRVERVIVDNIDQWAAWRYFPDDLAPVMSGAGSAP